MFPPPRIKRRMVWPFTFESSVPVHRNFTSKKGLYKLIQKY